MKKKFKTIKDPSKRSFVDVDLTHSNKIEKTRSIAVSLCKSEGFELVHLEYKREFNGKVLRLFIDKLDEGNITVEDCANISRQLSDILDVEWNDSSSYQLEVSSPGSNQIMVSLKDFVRYEGKKVKVTLVNTIGGRKIFFGKIICTYKNRVELFSGKETITLEHNNIAQARLMVFNGDS